LLDKETCVGGVEHTVAELVARFALRRNASSAEFLAGVWLVHQGAVYLRSVSARALQAVIRDDPSRTVSLVAEGEKLVGDCSCGARGEHVCRHQVAAAHAFWLEQPRLE
jgi:uncharacterized Zn finger protein